MIVVTLLYLENELFCIFCISFKFCRFIDSSLISESIVNLPFFIMNCFPCSWIYWIWLVSFNENFVSFSLDYFLSIDSLIPNFLNWNCLSLSLLWVVDFLEGVNVPTYRLFCFKYLIIWRWLLPAYSIVSTKYLSLLGVVYFQ